MSEIDINKKKRLSDILFDHWNKVRGERLFPSIDEIDEFYLKEKGVWDDVFIVGVYPLVQSNGYNITYSGANLSQENIKDNSGKWVKNLVTGILDNATDKYNMVAEQKRPFNEDEVYTSPETGVTIKYRQILLPLGPADNEPVANIIGGMRLMHN